MVLISFFPSFSLGHRDSCFENVLVCCKKYLFCKFRSLFCKCMQRVKNNRNTWIAADVWYLVSCNFWLYLKFHLKIRIPSKNVTLSGASYFQRTLWVLLFYKRLPSFWLPEPRILQIKRRSRKKQPQVS